jgi:DMSO/TMAO reductase YedYZ molybdopterin-dependent catalytic subunit
VIASLPPGQTERTDFPRFGLGRFAARFPRAPASIVLEFQGIDGQSMALTSGLSSIPRSRQRSDFHCVTTWSVRDLIWEGYRFEDIHRILQKENSQAIEGAEWIEFRGADGYRSILKLEDLLSGDVMLADSLGGQPLSVEHGAPLRLVAPAHYGYKNVKHLTYIRYRRSRRGYRFALPYPGFMDHPRARVALEERAIGLPPALVRSLYRLLVPSAVWRFRRAMRKSNS